MNESNNVLIMTRRAGYNPGSLLQAYALQQTIKRLGYANQILNYDEYKLRWKLRPTLENSLYAAMSLWPWFFQKVWPSEYIRLQNRRIQRRKFDVFEHDFLKITTKRYKSSRSLAKDVRSGDIYVCGSDQIWHPRLFDRAMFLDFAQRKQTRTIAYAPSLGLDKIEERRAEIGKLISGIDYVTVREGTGAEQIDEMVGRKVETALDPTLLLSRADWDHIKVSPSGNQPYILCYFLGSQQNPHKFIDELRERTGLQVKVIQMYYSRSSIDGDRLSAIDPCEFLGLVAGASFVCTDSFHCAIFSIIFERQFFCFAKFKSGTASSNHRINYLLVQFGLCDRLLSPKTSYSEDFGLAEIDYGSVGKIRERLKNESLDFLINSLNA